MVIIRQVGRGKLALLFPSRSGEVMNLQITLIIAILWVAVGCSPSPSATSTPDPAIATAEATAATTNNSNGSVITYVDKKSGVAFDYPNGWSILEPTTEDAVIYSYSIASYDMTNSAGLGKESTSGVPPGQTKIDITFYGAEETPDSARRTVQADVDSGFAIVTKEETRTAPDGSPAYYYEINGRLGGSARVIYTRINGHTVGVVAYGSEADFEAVVKSLREG